MKKMRIGLWFMGKFGVGLLMFGFFSGCASQRQVVVGLSPELEDYYTIYPSIAGLLALTLPQAPLKRSGHDGSRA